MKKFQRGGAMKLSDIPAPLFYIGAAAVFGFVLWRYVLPKVGQAINPLNDNNVFASGANALGGALTGDDSFSLGGSAYSALHRDPTEAPANWTADSWARHLRLTGG